MIFDGIKNGIKEWISGIVIKILTIVGGGVGVKLFWGRICDFQIRHPDMTLWAELILCFLLVCLSWLLVNVRSQLKQALSELANERCADGLLRFDRETTAYFNPQSGDFICPTCLAEKKQRVSMSDKFDRSGGYTEFECPSRHTFYSHYKLAVNKNDDGAFSVSKENVQPSKEEDDDTLGQEWD